MLKTVLTLPIAQREMLVMAKSPAFYRTRLGSSVVLFLFGIGFGLIYHYAGVRAIGEIVQVLAFILITVCMFAGVHLTSDSIAREKREGTLGLLFLTHMSPFQIVLGKLLAHGLAGFYWVLLTIPLLSLLLIVGGMRGVELATLGVAGLNMIFFSSAVGLYASTLNTDRKKAAGTGTWIIMFFWWGLPLLIQLLISLKAPLWLCQWLGVLSLTGVFNSPFAGPRTQLVDSPLVQLLSTHLLGWFFTWMAVSSLKRHWQDQPARAKVRLRDRWKQLSFGKPEVRLRLRQRLLEINPFLWLSSRDRLRPIFLWVLTVLLIGLMIYIFPFGLGAGGLFLSLAITLNLLHKAMIAGTAGHQLVLEQEQGTLEMLISTPLRVEDVLLGQFKAVLRQFKGPVALGFLLQASCIAGFIYLDTGIVASKMATVSFYLSLNALIYLFDLYTLIWVGMWSALIVRDGKNAGGAAMVRVIILPSALFALIIVSISLVHWWMRSPFTPSPELLAPLWFGIGIGNNVAWLLYVRKRLPAKLRTFALRRYSPDQKGSWLNMLTRKMMTRSPEPPLIASLPGRTQN